MLTKFLLDVWKRGPGGALASDAPAAQPANTTLDLPQAIPLDAVNCLVRGRHGWFLANRNDLYLGRALIRYGEYGEIEHAFLASLLSPGDNVVEIGANIGSHSVGLARAIGPAGTLVAVEPQPAVFRTLCANLALNAVQNVRVHACGCGEKRETLSLPAIDYDAARPHNSGGVSLQPDGCGISVPVVPLDDLTEDLGSVRLVKIDVEGMEQAVLRGSRGLLERCRPLLYVENDRIEKSRPLIEHLWSEGYRLWWHTPALFNPFNHFGETENDYPNIGSINMFCQPREVTADPPMSLAPLVEVVDPDYHPCAPAQADKRG